ncbi:MAG TPA: flagellar hook basal-body protein [Bryobacteraceae bacterium]|nr:flagellar hook basal-body protein [Bryobacteraceae bacterium]
MDPLLISAASGLRSRMEALELVANNLANAGTAGFKSDREFYGLYSAPESDSAVLPVIERRWTDFSQGTLTPTGNTTDLALASSGFFTVRGPQGPLHTRNGNFRIAGSMLASAEGYPALGTDGKPIMLDPARPFEVGLDGAVKQDSLDAGRIAVVEFAEPQALEKMGRSYYRASEAARPAADVEVHQGKLESANVGVPESAVRMVGILRQFEMLQKAVALGSEMGRRSVEEVAKVNP